MTQVKNIRPIEALEGKSSYKTHSKKLPNISNLQVLRSTIYKFIYKKEQNLKSKKFQAWVLEDIFVRYDGHIIYRVFIWSQDKVI